MAARKKKQTETLAGWRSVFADFLQKFEIDSKETGRGIIKPWGTQNYWLDQLAAGMDEGIRFFVGLKIRQAGICLGPDTRVLTADLEWVRIADVPVGAEVVAVDENTGVRGKARRMRTATVEGKQIVHRFAYRISFDDGRSVVCTAQHPWLSQGAGEGTIGWRSLEATTGKRGRTRRRLRIGSYVRWITKPWGAGTAEDGWFGGMLDGEGSLDNHARRGCRLHVCQRKGAVWDRLLAYNDSKGYHGRIERDEAKPERPSKFGKAPVPSLHFTRADEIFQIIGQTRPTRFLGKRFWEGRELPGKKSGIGWAKIVRIEPLGFQDVVDLQTSCGTYIAEGFVSHNTTITVPVDVLWCLIHDGLKGAIIANSPEVAANCRAMVRTCWERLPETHKLPIEDDNAKLTRWSNKSELHYLVAGKTERNTGLGKSHGFSLIHGTEVGEWGSEEGLNSLIASLAQNNPQRLYMFESTAQGKNLFWKLWNRSLEHPERKCVFIPWYVHDLYKLDKRSKSYAHYADRSPDDHEKLMIEEVRKLGHELTPGQIAWYRKTRDDMTSLDAVKQNFPSWPEEAFIASAPSFFPGRAIALAHEQAERDTFKALKIFLGEHVTQTRIEPMTTPHGADLQIWEDPRADGVYVVAMIPSEEAGAELGGESVVQVLRCYADKIEQVAEYAACVDPYQLAWVGAYLAGVYQNCYVNMEMTGIGRTVFREFQHLREQLNTGALQPDTSDPDRFLQSIVFYLYQRIDSASGASRTYHWLGKGDPEKTKEIYLDFKNSWMVGRAILHSVPLLSEMEDVISDGDYFGPDGDATDNRVYTFCVALRTWLDSVRGFMVAQGQTYEHERARQSIPAPMTFLQTVVDGFFRSRGVELDETAKRARR